MSARPSSCAMEKESTLERRRQNCTCCALESDRWNENVDEKLTRPWCIDRWVDFFYCFFGKGVFTRDDFLPRCFFFCNVIHVCIYYVPLKTYRQRNEYSHHPLFQFRKS